MPVVVAFMLPMYAMIIAVPIEFFGALVFAKFAYRWGLPILQHECAAPYLSPEERVGMTELAKYRVFPDGLCLFRDKFRPSVRGTIAWGHGPATLTVRLPFWMPVAFVGLALGPLVVAATLLAEGRLLPALGSSAVALLGPGVLALIRLISRPLARRLATEVSSAIGVEESTSVQARA